MAAIVTGLRPRPVPMTLHAERVAKPRGRPGLFALDVDSPAAVELHAELSAALVAAGIYEPEKRPFWPHLTVAEVRTGQGRKRRPRRVRTGAGGAAAGSRTHAFVLSEPLSTVRICGRMGRATSPWPVWTCRPRSDSGGEG